MNYFDCDEEKKTLKKNYNTTRKRAMDEDGNDLCLPLTMLRV